jgi:dephospho-CoA kinase
MIKIGITGSIASGKSTVAKLICKKKTPLFSADKTVQNIYKNKIFQKKIKKIFLLKNKKNIKIEVKKIVKNDKFQLKKLELIIHPLVRKKMWQFIRKNRKKNIIVLEIPLLFESKLSKQFDVILFVDATKKIRLERYLLRNGKKDVFLTLNNRQIKSKHKIKLSDYVVKNNHSLNKLKKNITKLCTKFF